MAKKKALELPRDLEFDGATQTAVSGRSGHE